METDEKTHLGNIIDTCRAHIEATSDECPYCVGWWLGVLHSLGLKLRYGLPIEKNFVELRSPARAPDHGNRCRLNTRLKEGALRR